MKKPAPTSPQIEAVPIAALIGMSVPPKMTEQVARAVIDQWLTA